MLLILHFIIYNLCTLLPCHHDRSPIGDYVKMSRSQLDGKIQFKFFLHMNDHVKCSRCVPKISYVHFLSLSLDYCMRCGMGTEVEKHIEKN